MGKIHNVEKMTDNRFVNLYHVDATSIHNTPVSYFVASRAKSIEQMKIKTRENTPDGVIIYSLYGEKKDRVVLVRQYRYPLDDYVYELPSGLVDQGEDYRQAGIREMKEETGLDFSPLTPDTLYERPFFTSVGMMLLAMMPIYALGYDERCRWERYALAMPVRKSDLFWSRFLLGVIAIALGAAVQALAALLSGRGELLSSLAVTAPSAVVYLLITLPLMMKLGVEKGRFLLLLLTMAFMLLSGALA